MVPAAGGDQRHLADLAHPAQLLQIVTVAHAVLVHHVSTISPAPRRYFSTQSRVSHWVMPGAALVAGILVDVILAGFTVEPGVDAYHDALHAGSVPPGG